jgi:thiol-disulfide isomerase/thioredoxin
MSFLSIIVATAGLSLGLVGPEGAKECTEGTAKACCSTEKECATAEAKAEGECCALGEASAEKMPMIDSALYGNAAWPAHNKGESLYAKDLQGQTLQVSLGKETWISEKASTQGKVVVLDFWATWCPPCRSAMPILDKMQKADPENLAVIAIGGQSEDEETVRSYLEEHEESIHNLFDENQAVFKQFESQGIPLVVVMSTDGVVRWIGNPHDENFQAAVAQTIEVDPMIKAKG